jgi:hypothetical protein
MGLGWHTVTPHITRILFRKDCFASTGSAASVADGTETNKNDDTKISSDEDECDQEDGNEDESDQKEEGDEDECEDNKEAVPVNYYGGYDAEMHQGWRCLVGRPPTEKEFSGRFECTDGEADDDRVTCVFTDGWTFVLAALTVGMLKAKEKAKQAPAPGAYWSSDDGQWHVRVKSDRERLAFLKGPGKSSQICQVKVKLLSSEEEACELIKKIANELISGTLLNTKETIYKRRDELLQAVSAPTVMKRPSAATGSDATVMKRPSTVMKVPEDDLAACDPATAAPTTPVAKRSRLARSTTAAAKAHGNPGLQMGFDFAADDLAGMDESMANLMH